MKKLRKFLADHSLLLLLIFLFIAFLIGQVFAGAAQYNETRATHGLSAVGYWHYVGTGNFLHGVFSNWQAAILQLGSLIIFGIFLRERGAAHSLQPGEPAQVGKSAQQSQTPRRSAKHSAKAAQSTKTSDRSARSAPEKTRSWIYCNSLSIAFMSLFVGAFVAHLFSGAAAYNEQRVLGHQPPLSTAAFAVSSRFWFWTFQTWEAEFMAIALYIFLTIFLRQEGSPESKPVGSRDTDTGETNK